MTADELRLRQIILNLLSNAVKFTPRQGRVTIGADIDTDGSLTLWVADTGVGMTGEEAIIALQPFRQVDNSLQRLHAGTGLGLPLTENLIELHGGMMTIDSAPGKGTKVTASFPSGRVRPRDSNRPARQIA